MNWLYVRLLGIVVPRAPTSEEKSVIDVILYGVGFVGIVYVIARLIEWVIWGD